MRKIIFGLLILWSALMASASMTDKQIDKKVKQLLKRMTLEEKIGQMNQYSSNWDLTGPQPDDDYAGRRYEEIKKGLVGSMLNVNYADETRIAQELAVENSRLGIPMMFGYDVIHGYRTIFPIPLGMAATWDMNAIEQAAQVEAREAAAAGLHWTFNPMVDVCRDPRWGRVMESPGEDPYLGSMIARAKISGYQGNDLSDKNTIAACAKHFAAYGGANAGRDYNFVDISLVELFNIYLPPFEAAADEGVATFMNAFNTINGIPATGNKFLVNEILKEKWNWEGFMVSDWGSIRELISHGTATDLKHASEISVNGGTDMDMESQGFVQYLKVLVKEGKVSKKLIDDAVGRILTIKYRLGLFDDPYKYCDEKLQEKELFSEENRAISLEVAKKSIVMLKNENNTLPLSRDLKKIAVIGPLAKDKDAPIGNWRGQAEPDHAISLYEGIEKQISENTELLYAEGGKIETTTARAIGSQVEFNTIDKSGIAAAVEVAKDADVVVAAVGETAFMSGEARSRMNIDLPGFQKELLQELKKLGKPMVVVVFGGRPMTITWTADNADAVLESWLAGSMSGDAIAEILFGQCNPSGKLPITIPRYVGQIPIFYNHLNTGRPKVGNGDVFRSQYIDGPNKPLYPFGYGLSYSEYEYKDLKLSKTEMKSDEKVTVSLNIINTSDVDGEEIVQLYIRDKVSSISRPVKELKGFKRVKIKAGKTEKINFEITQNDLFYYNDKYEKLLEPGTFEIMVGKNSDDVLTTELVVK